MIYVEYEQFKKNYLDAQRDFESILTEKNALFQMTQPTGISTENEKVQSTPQGNKFDNYLIEKEKRDIDSRLEEAKSLLEDWHEILRYKENELRLSKCIYDRIYVLRFLERMKVKEICKIVNYSEPQTFRILKNINHDRKMIGNDSF